MNPKALLQAAIIIVILLITCLIIGLFVPDNTKHINTHSVTPKDKIIAAEETIQKTTDITTQSEKPDKTEDANDILFKNEINNKVIENDNNCEINSNLVLSQMTSKNEILPLKSTIEPVSPPQINIKETAKDDEPASKIEQQKQPSTAKTHTAQLSQNNKSTAAVTAADITLSKNKIPKINKRVKKAKTKKQLIYELEVQIAKYFWENVSFPNGYVTEFNFCLDDGNVADITVKSTPQNEYFNRKDVTTYRLYSDRKKAELGNNKVFSAKIYPFVCHKRTLRDYRTNRFKAVYAHNTPDGEFLIDLYNFIKNSGTNHYNKCSGSDYKVVNGIYKGNKLRVTVHDAVK